MSLQLQVILPHCVPPTLHFVCEVFEACGCTVPTSIATVIMSGVLLPISWWYCSLPCMYLFHNFFILLSVSQYLLASSYINTLFEALFITFKYVQWSVIHACMMGSFWSHPLNSWFCDNLGLAQLSMNVLQWTDLLCSLRKGTKTLDGEHPSCSLRWCMVARAENH